MRPGMMPILHSPGVMIPGQLGPIRRTPRPAAARRSRDARARSISLIGMPSVMQAITATPASAASTIASAAKGGGTKIIEASAPVARTASETVSKTGIPSWIVPPLPGVTPATTCVPYSRHASAWNVPSRPVSPWTSSLVFFPTQMLTSDLHGRPGRLLRVPGRRGRDDLRRRVGEPVGRRDLEARLPQDGLALVHVGSLEAHDDGNREPHLAHGGDDTLGDDVAAHDAAEDVDE